LFKAEKSGCDAAGFFVVARNFSISDGCPTATISAAQCLSTAWTPEIQRELVACNAELDFDTMALGLAQG